MTTKIPANAIPFHTGTEVDDTSTQLLDANSGYRFRAIQNQGVETLYIKFGAAATADRNSLVIIPGGILPISNDDLPPVVINGICESGKTTDVHFLETTANF